MRGEVGDLHVGTRYELHNIVETESLQVVDGLTTDDGRSCFAGCALLGHDFHVVERKRLRFHAEGEPHIIAGYGDVVGQRFIAHVGHFDDPLSIRDVFEDGYSLHVGGSVSA